MPQCRCSAQGYQTAESDADAIMKTTYVGTRGYQAPELSLDKPYDFACDIFSMGVVLFILITGYPPFEQAHYSDRWFRPLAKGDFNKFWKYHAGCSISNLLQKMSAYDPKLRSRNTRGSMPSSLRHRHREMGKELIRALRHRHREMETKRRRDARKIKDLQVSVTPQTRSIDEEPITAEYDGDIEQILSNCYCHFEKPNAFFELLSGLVGGAKYSGKTEYNHETATMACHINIMEKLLSDDKSIKRDYTFEVTLHKSKQYVLAADESENKEASNEDDAAAQADEDAHLNSKNKETVYVVTTKKIKGDELKFRGLQRKLMKEGFAVFNGLPEWAQKMEESGGMDAFDDLIKNWDNVSAEDEQKDNEYADMEWDQED